MRTAVLFCLILILAALISNPASAQERRRGETGAMLWDRCKDGPVGPRWESCAFFVGLAFEFMHATEPLLLDAPEKKACFTGTFDAERESLMFADYLRAHPEQHDMRAIELFYQAMREKYPCVPETETKP